MSRRSPSTSCSRGRAGFWLSLLVLGLAAASLAGAEEDPAPAPAEPETVLLAGVVSDPVGEATRLVEQALAAYVAEDLDLAFERLVTLAEQHPYVLVPASLFAAGVPGRADGALRWRARRMANHALATLPAALRERLERRWAPATETLWKRANRGDERALAVLASEYGATARGSGALLLLAERDFESGRATAAARRLEQWLEFNPEAPADQRGAVVLRLTDALGTLQDAGALRALQVAQSDLRDVAVDAGGARTTLGDRAARWRQRPRPARPSASRARELARPPPLLWSTSLADADYLRETPEPPVGAVVRAGVWGEGRTVVLHAGRTVRRLDLLTGLERWRFPGVLQAATHDPKGHMHAHDLPFRAVTAQRGRVLVVLGEPAATGRYTFLEQEFDAQRVGQERRTRLVCLDLETGRLLWTTGGARDTHPVLGHRATGCASPPLVHGNDVYCLFARRLGATAFFLARLDLETGRPVWVAPLASGGSGRSDDRGEARNRFTGTYVQSVPWGARPTLYGGEVCVVPHAGFAAGVAAASGAVRWLRALPRFALHVTQHASVGHNVRNAPLAWGDAWLIAPMDAPHLLCLARGTGDLRWQRGGRTPADLPPWRDLLGVDTDAQGAGRIRLSGPDGLLAMNPADGSRRDLGGVEAWTRDEDDPGGAALDLGTHVALAAGGSLQVQGWEDGAAPRVRRFPLDEAGCPRAGDLYRIGDTLLLVGTERVAALAVGDAALAAGDADLPPRGEAIQGLVDRGLRAVLAEDAAALTRVVQQAARALPAGAEAAWERLADDVLRLVAACELREEDPWGQPADDAPRLAALADAAEALPPAWQGEALHRLAQILLRRKEDARASALLLRWLERADDALVDAGEGPAPPTRVRMRGDLLAGALLRAHVERPGVRAALEAREGAAVERLQTAEAAGEPALREALRRTAGTRAAAWARRRWRRRLLAAGRFGDAAAVAADLRLERPWLDVGPAGDARRAELARLQMAEAVALGEAYEGRRARLLVADLERWSPAGLRDETGHTVSDLAQALRRRFGWYPVRDHAPPGIDVWKGEPQPDRDDLRSVEWLGLRGPGAAALDDRALCVRGLTLEVWSVPGGERLATVRGDDEGWFGGSLTGVDPWVPGGGILVSSIVAGEPADRGGVRGGDWVRRWNGAAVRDLPTFMNLVASSRPGTAIDVEVDRHGRPVLERFTTGRRPAGQGRMLDYAPLWATADGRVLLPGRTGLAWIDVRAGTRSTLWTWGESGVVRRVRVLPGRAYATVQRGLLPDLVVAVDLETGREAWRTEIPGAVTWTEPVGSGLWIQSVGPARATLVDRHSGQPRAVYACFDFRRHEFRKTWAPASPAAVAAGRGYVVSGSERHHEFRIVNTSTGHVEYADRWSHRYGAGYDLYVNPQVAAGAYVAIVRAPGLRLVFPDPFGGPPQHVLDVDANQLLSGQRHYGAVDSNARVYVRGSTLYLLRVPSRGRQNVNVCVFGIGYEALGAGRATTDETSGAAFFMRTNKIWMSGSSLPIRYAIDAEATIEGILVCAARLADEHQAEHWWVASMTDDDVRANGHTRLLLGGAQDARRYAPTPSGSHLLVPTDAGAYVFRIGGYSD